MNTETNMQTTVIDFNQPNPPFKVEAEVTKLRSNAIEIRIIDIKNFILNKIKEFNYKYDKLIYKTKIKFKKCENPITFEFIIDINNINNGFYTTITPSMIGATDDVVKTGKVEPDIVEISIFFFDTKRLIKNFEYNLENIEASIEYTNCKKIKKSVKETSVSNMIHIASPIEKNKISKFELSLYDNDGVYLLNTNMIQLITKSDLRYLKYMYVLVQITFGHAIVEFPVIMNSLNIFETLKENINIADKSKKFFKDVYLGTNPFNTLLNEFNDNNGNDDKMIIRFYYPECNDVEFEFYK